MAHKKGGGSTRNNRDSQSKRLGIKVFAKTQVSAGNILLRQKGNKWWPGEGTYQGTDFTIHAKKEGEVFFIKKQKKRFDGIKYERTFVCVK